MDFFTDQIQSQSKDWNPTLQLQQVVYQDREGKRPDWTVIQQKWESNYGDEEWRTIPIIVKPEK